MMISIVKPITMKEAKRMSKIKNDGGFSLVELLVVVAILLLIASIAIVNLSQARKSANESAAVSNLRTLVSSEFAYATRNGQNFGLLSDLTAQKYTDSRFSTGGAVVNGFRYDENYSVQGLPAGASTTVPSGFGFHALNQGSEASYDFAAGVDGVIRYGASPAPGKNPGDAVGK